MGSLASSNKPTTGLALIPCPSLTFPSYTHSFPHVFPAYVTYEHPFSTLDISPNDYYHPHCTSLQLHQSLHTHTSDTAPPHSCSSPHYYSDDDSPSGESEHHLWSSSTFCYCHSTTATATNESLFCCVYADSLRSTTRWSLHGSAALLPSIAAHVTSCLSSYLRSSAPLSSVTFLSPYPSPYLSLYTHSIIHQLFNSPELSISSTRLLCFLSSSHTICTGLWIKLVVPLLNRVVVGRLTTELITCAADINL